MKNQLYSSHSFTAVCSAGFLAAFLLLGLAPKVSAQLVWNGGGSVNQGSGQDGSGVWDETTADWDQFSDTLIPWTDNGVAYIGSGGAAGTITVSAPVKVGDIYFEAVGSGSYNLAADANNDPLTFVNGAQLQVYPNVICSISCPIVGGFEYDGAGTMTINVVTNIANLGNVEKDNGGTLIVNGDASGEYGLGTVTCNGGVLMVSDSLGGAGSESVSNCFMQGGIVASAPTGGSIGGVEGYTMNFLPGGSNAFGVLQIDGNNNLQYATMNFDLDLSTTSSATGTAGAGCANDYISFTGTETGAPNSMNFYLNFVGAQPASGTVLTYTVLNYTGLLSSSPPTVSFPAGGAVTSAVLNTNSNPYTITVTFGSSVVVPPVSVNCPASMTVPDTEAGGGAVVYFSPTASGGCTTPTVITVPASGSNFADGTTTVYCTAYDTCGDTNTCSFNVTVTPPGSGPASQAITSIVNSGSGSATLTYNATGGFTYDVQYTTSIKPPVVWTTIPAGNNTPGASGPVIFTDLNASANAVNGQIFYRTVSP